MRVVPLVLIVVAVTGGAASAQSPVADHLQCFQIKSSARTPVPSKLTADLHPADDPPFPVAAGCRVKTKPRLLCIDVAKQNVQPPGGWTLPVSGDAAREYLCYDVKCPPPAGGLVGGIVTDQFGEHVVTTRVTRTLCVPAIHGPMPRPTAAPCGDAGSGQCSDECPGQYRCLFVPAGFDLIDFPSIPIDIIGANDCRCVPPTFACADVPGGACHVTAALCPNAGDACVVGGPSGCSCQPAAPAPCGSVSCPVGTVCCDPLHGICAPPGYACTQ